MNRIKVACAAALMAVAAFGADGRLSGSAGQWKGLEIRFVTKIEPPGTQLPGGVIVEAGRVHHVIDDRAHKRAFGYDVVLEPSEDGKSAGIRIEAWNPAESKITFDLGWTFLGLPNYPVIAGVKMGDTVALDLLVNAATGQKVVDYLTLGLRGDMDLRRAPRDFQLADVELTLLDPRISVGGKPEPATAGAGGFSGAAIWMYIKGRGRFVLSLVPNEKLGFRKNGLISGNGLLFHDGAAEIRVDCSGQIAPGGGPYNLYVVHEPGWLPGDAALMTMGSADKPEYIIGKQ
jgi:hypothetical protein